MTNNQLTRSVLTVRQSNSLLNLKARADANPNKTMLITAAQLKAMRTAYRALVAAGADLPEEVQKSAKQLGIV